MAAPERSRRAILAWCMYDFANSSFATLVVTFIYASFFTSVIASDEIAGTALWSRGVTVTALLVAFLSPILGAIADRGAYRKTFLLIATAIGVTFTALLYFPKPGQTVVALVVFVIANVAFEMGSVFYNAFLPDIAPPERLGRISGHGWALGYVGGLLAMFVAMVGFVSPDVPWFGVVADGSHNIRATNLLVAAWFAVFSIPLFLWVKEDRTGAITAPNHTIAAGFRQLVASFHEMRRYRQVVRLLVARLVYNDGLVTIFAFGGIYATGTFGFTFQELMVFGIGLNVTAGLGAFLFGFVDDRLGGKVTILVSVAGLFVATLLAVIAPSRELFWVASLLVGTFSGPNQAASRSLMARFVPPDKENEFFGLFAFSGKATAFMGPALLGVLTSAFGNQRAGIAVLLVFFAVGGALMLGLDEKEGIASAGRPKG